MDAIRWLENSTKSESDLAQHDNDAEDSFNKLHKSRTSQVSVTAVCGCGRSVEGKKTFEKAHYSNTSERKLRSILLRVENRRLTYMFVCEISVFENLDTITWTQYLKM